MHLAKRDRKWKDGERKIQNYDFRNPHDNHFYK